MSVNTSMASIEHMKLSSNMTNTSSRNRHSLDGKSLNGHDVIVSVRLHKPRVRQIMVMMGIKVLRTISSQVCREVNADGCTLPQCALNVLWACQPYMEPQARHDLGRMDIVCSRCNALRWHAERVASKSTANFSAFITCCNQGQVRLLVSDPPPEFISNLFTSTDDPQAQEFQENIRQYNAALAFTSLGVQLTLEGEHSQ
ncbi:hypothetical protein SCP_1200570 [Sparassis crispa]|uniref:Helitron helicase-like domain-containing protein n=1 Tax=Sparassis crispa TaxID=139825 RepID=A0A401H0A2_9APHY|nr:hypothetical protein SCP_1200570 [Sparassis crispa]GBE87832.1 hypothetical protein SCP_1200570 [Sparassis crispa]